MFFTRTDDDVCDICKHNGREKCRHRNVNDKSEIKRKTENLLSILIANNKRRFGCDKELVDFLPESASQCFNGYSASKQELVSDIVLRETVGADGILQRPLVDYIDVLHHSEEEESVLKCSKIFYNPESIMEGDDIHDINFNSNGNSQAQSTFNNIVIDDLLLRGYKIENIMCEGNTAESRRLLLLDCLKMKKTISMLRNALLIERRASKSQIVPIDQVIPCILHAKNRTVEKFLHQLILLGVRNCRGTVKCVRILLLELNKL